MSHKYFVCFQTSYALFKDAIVETDKKVSCSETLANLKAKIDVDMSQRPITIINFKELYDE